MSATAMTKVPWWKEPTKDQWHAWIAAWLGWTLDSFDFTVFLLIMVPIAKKPASGATFRHVPASVSRPMASILVVGTTRSVGLNWLNAPAWVWVDIVLFLCSIGSGHPDRHGRRAAHHESMALATSSGSSICTQ